MERRFTHRLDAPSKLSPRAEILKSERKVQRVDRDDRQCKARGFQRVRIRLSRGSLGRLKAASTIVRICLLMSAHQNGVIVGQLRKRTNIRRHLERHPQNGNSAEESNVHRNAFQLIIKSLFHTMISRLRLATHHDPPALHISTKYARTQLAIRYHSIHIPVLQ
jgi:hypothetical protein